MFFELKEPNRWKYLLEISNDFVAKNDFLSKTVPVTADIFVFTYPLYLVSLYLYWVYNKNVDYKYASLYIFFSGFFWLIASQMFQFLIIKDRPENHVVSKKNLILEHLPDISFPSDHMTLWIAIAASTLFWWIKSKNKFYIICSYFLFLFAFIMWFSRVAWWVHWPTDIIWWFVLWILIPLILIRHKVFRFIQKYLFDPLISIQKKIFKIMFWIDN